MSNERSLREEALSWVEKLKVSATPHERMRAASQLHGIGVRARGVVGTRGSSSRAADGLVSARDFGPVLRELRDQPVEVRREVAFALAEVGGEDFVEPLAQLADDPDYSVRLVVADALSRIGGPKAVEELLNIARTDPEERVRALAWEALGTLAVFEHEAEAAAAVTTRPRGAVKTRGAVKAVRPRGRSGADRVVEALKLGLEDRSPRVRQAVEDILYTLRHL